MRVHFSTFLQVCYLHPDPAGTYECELFLHVFSRPVKLKRKNPITSI